MDSLYRLVDSLRCLPGIGPKSAQRMAFHLLHNHRQRGLDLATCLEHAMKNIGHCQICNNYTEDSICVLCQNPSRDSSLLCIVESPADLLAIEQSHAYNGRYFVLMGKISPIDGLGPEEIGLPKLRRLVSDQPITELVLALSPSIEGQTTIHFIKQLFSAEALTVTQLAHGIPSGGELEFLDSNTISSALRNRAMLHV
jgi:recombination protein RecR